MTKVHHVRHAVASLLKALRVPARDTRLAIRLKIYTYTDDEVQLDALTRVHNISTKGKRIRTQLCMPRPQCVRLTC